MNKLWFLILSSVILLAMLRPCDTYGQETMRRLPIGAYDQYFNFFSPDDSSLPSYIKTSAQGVVGVEYSNMRVVTGAHGAEGVFAHRNGTGFFIQTFRDDNKVCFCTAKHVVEAFKTATCAPNLIFFDGYTKYFGKSSTDSPYIAVSISGYKSTMAATIVAETDDDASLLLVDVITIPGGYIMLGYDLSNPAMTDIYYTLGCPLAMHTRMADNIKNPVIDPILRANNVYLVSASNGYIGLGWSGGPVVKHLTSSAAVSGIVVSVLFPATPIPDSELVDIRDRDKDLEYYGRFNFVKIGALEAAIKKHCWKTKTEEELNKSQEYKNPVDVDMAGIHKSYYRGTPRNIAGSSQLAAAANTRYSANNPGINLVTGSSINITGSITHTNPATKMIIVISPTITLGETFSYTATGTNEIYFNSIALEPAQSSSARQAANHTKAQVQEPMEAGKMEGQQVFVYPNPTHGKFVVYIPEERVSRYGSLSIFNLTGTKMLEQQATGGANEVDISNASSGIYYIRVDNEEGLLLFGSKVIKKN